MNRTFDSHMPAAPASVRACSVVVIRGRRDALSLMRGIDTPH